MQFYIYSRKSVYTGKGESIENQIELCRSYIISKYPHDPHRQIRTYEDEGFSAKNTERPQFQIMLRDMKTDHPDFLVCYRLDRISRSVSDFSSFIEELNRLGIAFLCIKEEFDTSRPMGKAMMYIASVFSQLERETIAERVRDNMLLLARSGRWLGGTPPTGYTSEKNCEILLDGKIKTSCALRECPDELTIVRLIYRQFLTCLRVRPVTDYLNAHHLLTRTQKEFSPSAVRQILRNPVYCMADQDAFAYFTALNADVCFSPQRDRHHGLLAYNKRDYRQKGAPRQSVDHWILAAGKHHGIISGRDWVTVQRLLKTRCGLPPDSDSPTGILSGRLYCQHCGSPMTAKIRSRHSQRPTFDYICTRKLRQGVSLCSCQNLHGPQTEEDVLRALCSFLQNTLHPEKALHPEQLSRHKKRILITTFVTKILWDGAALQVLL